MNTLLAIGTLILPLTAIVLAVATYRKGAQHPQGRMGFLRDQALIIGPPMLFLVVLITRMTLGFAEDPAGVAVVAVSGFVLVGVIFLPAVRRARARLDRLYRFPPK